MIALISKQYYDGGYQLSKLTLGLSVHIHIKGAVLH